MIFSLKEKDQMERFRIFLVLFIFGAFVIYAILALFVKGELFIPALDADFNRSIIFFTILTGILLYYEDLEVVLGICFGGPIVAYIIAAFISIFISVEPQEMDAFLIFMATLTYGVSSLFVGGIGALVMNIITGWVASNFKSSFFKTDYQDSRNGVFSVINGKNSFKKTKELEPQNPHSKYQLTAILLFQIVILLLSSLMLTLPFYDYSFDSHLHILDLGVVPFLIFLFIIINVLVLILIILIKFNNPFAMKSYPPILIRFHSVFLGVGYFIGSLFFPNPSFLVGNYVVTSGIGIGILTNALILAFFFTPSLIEYLQFDTNKTKMNKSNG